jgi:hypothetical protein
MHSRLGELGFVRIAPALLVLAIPFQLAAIGDCIGPSSLCQRLDPDMVVFIGKPVSITVGEYRAATATFDIQELFWGPRGLRSITVLLDDGYSNKDSRPEFFAVRPLRDGRYLQNDCVGLNLPATHPFVDEYRRDALARRPASLSVKAQWHSYVPVAGTEVRLTGGGRTFQGKVYDDAGWEIAALPPGNYKVSATRPSFSQTWPKAEVSILPASCSDLRILMEGNSEVSGRVLDARGEPIRNATFHLNGQGRSLAGGLFTIASLRDAIFQGLGWTKPPNRDYALYNDTRTDNNGRFTFRDVFPGWYLLSSDISEVSENFQIPLPNTYYPGVYDWSEAQHLVVVEGQSIHNVLFRLPDFESKRRVVILVTGEDGSPVAGAVVQDSGLNPANQAAANSGAHQTTDATGQVILGLWPVASYRLTATLWGQNRSWSGEPVEIPPGRSDLKRTIVLKGLRPSPGHR